VFEAGENPLRALNVALKLGDQSFTDRGIRLRVEIDDGPFISIVEVASSVAVEASGKTINGMLVALDTLRTIESAEFWADPMGQLGHAHAILKNIFFDLLTKPTVEMLGPEWSLK